MSAYVCEFEFVEDGGMILAWPFWPGRTSGTEGYDLVDAVRMAADWLRMSVQDCLVRGEDVPDLEVGHEARRGGRVVAVAVETSLAEVPAMTAAEAARQLGVSTARVAQLCKSRLLDSWKVGGTRMVSLESVEARMSDSVVPGRPRKAGAGTDTTKTVTGSYA